MTLSSEARKLCSLTRAQLQERFDTGRPVIPEAIEGYRYRGVSLGLPAWIEKLSWKKFAKTFYRDERGAIRGVNLRIEQDSFDLPWRPQIKKGVAWSFGPFQLADVPGTEHIEIDYGLGSKGLSLMRRLRDPLRSLDDSGDLLLGCSHVDIGLGRRLTTPSWFLLERDQPL